MEPGKYVFLDNTVPDWSLIVVVSEQGSECNPTTASFQPTTPAQLVRHGIVKQHSLNLLPDWGLITGEPRGAYDAFEIESCIFLANRNV